MRRHAIEFRVLWLEYLVAKYGAHRVGMWVDLPACESFEGWCAGHGIDLADTIPAIPGRKSQPNRPLPKPSLRVCFRFKAVD